MFKKCKNHLQPCQLLVLKLLIFSLAFISRAFGQTDYNFLKNPVATSFIPLFTDSMYLKFDDLPNSFSEKFYKISYDNSGRLNHRVAISKISLPFYNYQKSVEVTSFSPNGTVVNIHNFNEAGILINQRRIKTVNDAVGAPISQVTEDSIGGIWKRTNSSEYGYFPNGKLKVQTDSSFNWVGSGLYISRRQQFEYDANQNLYKRSDTFWGSPTAPDSTTNEYRYSYDTQNREKTVVWWNTPFGMPTVIVDSVFNVYLGVGWPDSAFYFNYVDALSQYFPSNLYIYNTPEHKITRAAETYNWDAGGQVWVKSKTHTFSPSVQPYTNEVNEHISSTVIPNGSQTFARRTQTNYSLLANDVIYGKSTIDNWINQNWKEVSLIEAWMRVNTVDSVGPNMPFREIESCGLQNPMTYGETFKLPGFGETGGKKDELIIYSAEARLIFDRYFDSGTEAQLIGMGQPGFYFLQIIHDGELMCAQKIYLK